MNTRNTGTVTLQDILRYDDTYKLYRIGEPLIEKIKKGTWHRLDVCEEWNRSEVRGSKLKRRPGVREMVGRLYKS